MLPEIRITDSLVLPTYFVYLSLLYSILILILPNLARLFQRNVIIALNLGFILMASGFIGARLFHVFFEDWNLYRSNLERILFFWAGGYVFYGGAITAALAALAYLHKKNESIPDWFDFFSPIGALGYGFGRISCFLAGCCFGKTCELPWAIKGLHPTQLYASLWELATALLLFFLLKKNLRSGLVFWIWMALHSSGRLMMEYFRADFRGEFYLGLSISTWISLFILSAAIAVMFRFFGNSSRHQD